MNGPYRYSLCFCLLTAVPGMAAAETVEIPVGRQGSEFQDVEVPRRGMKKEAVEASFGAPRTRSRAVGEPPISFWEYEHYFVYFERDRVLHTVLKPGRNER